MVMQACKLNLPQPQPCTTDVTRILFEPHSHSLALMHSDSSILLFPSFSPFSPHPPLTHTLIPPPSSTAPSPSSSSSSSSCFLRLHSNHTLFILSSPNHPDSTTLLRFWILHHNLFIKPQLKCSQRDLTSPAPGDLLVSLTHGFSLNLYASLNFFLLHSVSARRIWILGAKVIPDDDDQRCPTLNLIKCAVIDSTSLPITSITLSPSFLLLGLSNGVTVFPLTPLLKGDLKKQRSKGDNKNNPRNVEAPKIEGKKVSVKVRTVKLKHTSNVDGAFFVAFTSPEVQNQKPTSVLLLSLKAVSVHALTQWSFLVLDSLGDLHLLSLSSSTLGSDIAGQMRRSSHTMKVQMLAVLPDICARTRTVWISDGLYSIHAMSASDIQGPAKEKDQTENEEEPMRISAMQAVFSSEKIQDLIPLSANAILVLGQGNVFAYAIS